MRFGGALRNICVFASILGNTCLSANASVIITVPGTSNPWLAGMPNGSIAGASSSHGYSGDTAPADSPAQVLGIPITDGEILTFSATGTVVHGGKDPAAGPEGITTNVTSLSNGAANGMANIDAPFDALIGVFLDDNQPDAFTLPVALDFSTQDERDFQTLSPALRQPFFIGDGLTSSSAIQEFIVPTGATRLFLGPMDDYQWNNNTGSFNVTVAIAPEPASLLLFAVTGFSLCFQRRR
jgi:hypothetical protein